MPFFAIAFPVFDPVAVAVGPFVVRWYALAYIAGILLGWLYARMLLQRERLWGGPAPITPLQFDDFILWVTIGIILGGRTGYVLFYNLDFFIAHPAQIFELWNGGMSFHGGFMGCVVAVMLFGWKRNVSIASLGDITCAVGPIGLFLGRIANFINGELWGRPADDTVPWAMVFPHAGPLPRHPSQLYEAGLEGLALFLILALMIRFGALKRPGLIIGAFLTFYGLARITGEFFREPDPQLGFLWGGMTMGMLLSIPMVIAGIVVMLVARRRTAGPPRPAGVATKPGEAIE
ncbi:MAG: prolipoprotein diacylglyceryl transferase [Rhodopseudomonas palustris]|uniref:Phosphatidylglycerol--prolipoprotein diacylglyceryl transferase n=1 Tax=Rhodopseudomonas palustris TaxID=1076 RepID=A0A933VXM5_RHOPL|nr:prolipoprotein diacylglyceryl transferase [Rhodopseudomonas palustris]